MDERRGHGVRYAGPVIAAAPVSPSLRPGLRVAVAPRRDFNGFPGAGVRISQVQVYGSPQSKALGCFPGDVPIVSLVDRWTDN